MLRISLNHTLNSTLNNNPTAFIWPICYLPILASNVFDGDGDWQIVVTMLLFAIAVVVGGIPPKLPESIFLMPVSCAQREKFIKKYFWIKLVVSALACFTIMGVSVMFGTVNVVAGILIAFDGISIAQLFALNGSYYNKNSAKEVLMVFMMIALVLIVIITVGFGQDDMGVATVIIGVISLILYIIDWANIGKKVEDMSKDLSDYEKLVITNLPLEKRAKLQEQGLL